MFAGESINCRFLSRVIDPMPRKLFTPSTMPAPSQAGPLFLFIERAQLEIYYQYGKSGRRNRNSSASAKIDCYTCHFMRD
jgi:hypothetical protein